MWQGQAAGLLSMPHSYILPGATQPVATDPQLQLLGGHCPCEPWLLNSGCLGGAVQLFLGLFTSTASIHAFCLLLCLRFHQTAASAPLDAAQLSSLDMAYTLPTPLG